MMKYMNRCFGISMVDCIVSGMFNGLVCYMSNIVDRYVVSEL